MKIVILAGGSGTRLWPYSRKALPKQFLHFGAKHSLFQRTILRFAPIAPFSDMFVVTNQEYLPLIKEQLKEIDPDKRCTLLVEPERKNTAPAIALVIAYLLNSACDPKECLLIASSDHLISPESKLLGALDGGLSLAQQGKSVLFGIRPSKPETGYGYIKADPEGYVTRFIEKPDASLAYEYLLSGDYLWNAGIFLFQIATWQKEIALYCPALARVAAKGLRELIAHFAELPDISIDCAVMEKSSKTVVIPLDVSWSDVGCWDSVYDILEKDENQNVKIGNVCAVETNNCLLFGTKRLVTTIGLEDLFVVETEDALLIGKKGQSQKVKQLYTELYRNDLKNREFDKEASLEAMTAHRPWGFFTVLEEGERYKIKRIVVQPLQKLSLQKHYHRSEHWVVIKGTAKVTLDDQEKCIHENESLFVPKGCVHRLENPGKIRLELIEVQVGEYVGEDDIVRLDDIYQRTTK